MACLPNSKALYGCTSTAAHDPVLEGIIRMYEHGGARPRRPAKLAAEQYYPTTTQLLTPFDLTPAERQALLAFIKAL